MRNIDDLIDKAVDAEERDLLRRIGEEPSYISQALDLFAGRTGWVSMLLMVAQTTLFILGAWASWRFFIADNILHALHWGLPAAVLLLMALIIKLSLWPVVHFNRVLARLKLIELLLARRTSSLPHELG